MVDRDDYVTIYWKNWDLPEPERLIFVLPMMPVLVRAFISCSNLSRKR